jgi:uncharacterized protein with PIN domain
VKAPAMMQRSEQQDSGKPAFKHCPVCHRRVLSAYRGEVTAVGKSEIERVKANGDVAASCECGATVTWTREISRPR